MKSLLPRIPRSPHVLSDERRAQIRADVLAQLNREANRGLPELTPEQEAWYEDRASDGRPLPGHPDFVATVRTGLRCCELCDSPTDGEDLCPSCLGVVEPFREDFYPVCDPNGTRL